MIGFEIFLIGLMIVSTLTSLVTEAVKKMLDELKIKYLSNTLAGIVAALLSIAVSVAYVLLAGIAFSAQVVVYIIILVFLSWLCSMVGYDKVVQVITQFKTSKKD